METLSYNEERNKKLKFRHIFYPDRYAFITEAIIAVLALILFNASELSNRLLRNSLTNDNPLSYSVHLLDQSFTAIQKYYIFQQVSIFLLWAVSGALVYILIFRLFQAVFGLTYNVNQGVKLVRREHTAGLFHWLSSLHDFFLKTLIVSAGFFVLIVGAFICFGTASQELRVGLIYSFSSSILPLIFSLIGAIVSIRLVILGMSLLSRRFRNWYIA